ncbi:MAG: NAD(P)H-hydrate dehydratase [Planctomycetaceae bacterium]|jgi:NAD(P)H-hydrate epimerase|nr:NAD(P)H-hydrate dehydratase [Planctomycetaceae bacterium]
MRSDIDSNLPKFSVRELISHKGTYGVVLGIGGSRGMAGSVALAGRAGLLVGAGLSRLAVPAPILETVAGFYPESTTIPLPADRNGKISLNAFDKLITNSATATSLFIGTGLGRSAGLDRLVPKILCQLDGYVKLAGIVVDADALNALSGQMPVFKCQNIIFTPHSAEFKRLTQKTNFNSIPDEDDQINRINVTKKFAKYYNVIVVLKGHETIVTDGNKVFINNKSGNPGMATGGCGDVLTGMIAGLIARGFGIFDSAKLGVYLHGVAGDIAAKKYGIESLTATHILESIPIAIIKINSELGR